MLLNTQVFPSNCKCLPRQYKTFIVVYTNCMCFQSSVYCIEKSVLFLLLTTRKKFKKIKTFGIILKLRKTEPICIDILALHKFGCTP